MKLRTIPSKILNSKYVWITLFIFIFYFDLLFTIFIISGGLKDGENYIETNPVIRRAIDSGNKYMVFFLSLFSAIVTGLQMWLWDKHWIWRGVFWILLIFRAFAGLQTIMLFF